jgi:hypothetical protein
LQASGGSSSRQDKARSLTPRILVAAHTNVAVDRVLLGLMDAGFSNMLRVGSLQRIAKRLLGMSLHSAGELMRCLCGCRVTLPWQSPKAFLSCTVV